MLSSQLPPTIEVSIADRESVSDVKWVQQLIVEYNLCSKVVVCSFDNTYYSIMPQKPLKSFHTHTIKCLCEVQKVRTQRVLPFDGLFNN